ncbi:DNA-formamidopyrimidine glycosylase [Lapidilactobacillus gannanensis]|uniref:Formamidopyrimidine-DNA glycosylase n=1 Tax=Lapidilactobacillus gannanensis TaxID=2486002 RepID=A0ABW4BMR9_9LACO|nr:DNA-formamidopyrimidine glycosylase [Lapidilactobacillus gannanensis]
MPELPEVETVRRSLIPLITGKKIARVSLYYPKIINGDSKLFQALLVGRTFETIDRRGKYLLFRFDEHLTMISHLRMEGKYYLEPTVQPHNKHVHVVFELTDGTSLQYQDVRKFGRMQLVDTGTEAQVSGIKLLGPEPLSSDFTVSAFQQGLQRHHKAIKPVLLDQKVVTGLGNIYVDEVLWLSQINPLTPANQLTLAQVKELHQQIIAELTKAVAAGGTTIRSYVDASGHSGHFQFDLNVYGEEGKPCPRCQTTIVKIKVGGRGTHFCPHCQPLPLGWHLNETEDAVVGGAHE